MNLEATLVKADESQSVLTTSTKSALWKEKKRPRKRAFSASFEASTSNFGGRIFVLVLNRIHMGGWGEREKLLRFPPLFV